MEKSTGADCRELSDEQENQRDSAQYGEKQAAS